MSVCVCLLALGPHENFRLPGIKLVLDNARGMCTSTSASQASRDASTQSQLKGYNAAALLHAEVLAWACDFGTAATMGCVVSG